MTLQRLPNVRVTSLPASNVIVLQSIGYRLRFYYERLLYLPVPERIDRVLRQLA